MTDFRGCVVTSAIDPELDPADLPEPGKAMTDRARQMYEIGWRPKGHAPDFADWTLGEPVIWADTGPLAEQAIKALQALGIRDPSELTVEAFRNGADKGDPEHVAKELGVQAAEQGTR